MEKIKERGRPNERMLMGQDPFSKTPSLFTGVLMKNPEGFVKAITQQDDIQNLKKKQRTS